MADRVFMPRALDDSGAVVDDAVAYFYRTGTTDPLVVFSDSDGETELGSTLAADATGVFAPVFANEPLRLDIKDGAGVSLTGFPSDTWYITPSTGVGASTITFEPIEGNSATNVQVAIANLTSLWNAVSTYGKSLIAAADAAAARTLLGLGGLATLNILDEDDFATDSATRPPSQQSTKTYVDAIAAALPVKAHCTFNGTGTVALIGGSGVSGVTDNGTGDYTLTFSPALPNTNYQVMLSCTGRNEATAGNANRVIANVKVDASGIVLKTTTQVRITTNLGATGTLVDVDEVYAVILS